MAEVWRLKAAVQRVCATVPMGERLYAILQSTVGGLRRLRPDSYVEACKKIIGATKGGALAGAATVEVGTGWNMSLPLALHLCGADSCVTFDATRYCRPREAMRSARALVPALREAVDEELRNEIDLRWEKLEGLAWGPLQEAAGISYRAPADAARTGLASGSQDIVFSRAVLQHIPPGDLARIFREAGRLLRAGGLMWHWLDLTDQRRMLDQKLSRIDYLRFSEPEWRRLSGNRYAYSNRWRISDYVQLAESEGFEVSVQNARVEAEAIDFARSGLVHADFAGRGETELGTVSADLVCRKP